MAIIGKILEENANPGGVTSYNDLTDKPTVPTALSELSEDTTHRVVTDTEKSTWDGKVDSSSIPVKAIGTEVTAGTNDTKFITPKAFADSSIKANHDWMLNLMQGNANGIDTDVVDATIVVFFEGEMMQISYSNLLAQLQSDLGL